MGEINVRPNLHIQDYCRLIEKLILAKSHQICNQIFNVGYQNMSIKEISQVVQRVVQKEFPDLEKFLYITTKSDDNRSYHINSDKVKEVLGFESGSS